MLGCAPGGTGSRSTVDYSLLSHKYLKYTIFLLRRMEGIKNPAFTMNRRESSRKEAFCRPVAAGLRGPPGQRRRPRRRGRAASPDVREPSPFDEGGCSNRLANSSASNSTARRSSSGSSGTNVGGRTTIGSTWKSGGMRRLSRLRGRAGWEDPAGGDELTARRARPIRPGSRLSSPACALHSADQVALPLARRRTSGPSPTKRLRAACHDINRLKPSCLVLRWRLQYPLEANNSPTACCLLFAVLVVTKAARKFLDDGRVEHQQAAAEVMAACWCW